VYTDRNRWWNPRRSYTLYVLKREYNEALENESMEVILEALRPLEGFEETSSLHRPHTTDDLHGVLRFKQTNKDAVAEVGRLAVSAEEVGCVTLPAGTVVLHGSPWLALGNIPNKGPAWFGLAAEKASGYFGGRSHISSDRSAIHAFRLKRDLRLFLWLDAGFDLINQRAVPMPEARSAFYAKMTQHFPCLRFPPQEQNNVVALWETLLDMGGDVPDGYVTTFSEGDHHKTELTLIEPEKCLESAADIPLHGIRPADWMVHEGALAVHVHGIMEALVKTPTYHERLAKGTELRCCRGPWGVPTDFGWHRGSFSWYPMEVGASPAVLTLKHDLIIVKLERTGLLELDNPLVKGRGPMALLDLMIYLIRFNPELKTHFGYEGVYFVPADAVDSTVVV
jgi:hypothetical protein